MRFRVSMMLLLGFAVFSASAFGQSIGSITGVVQDVSENSRGERNGYEHGHRRQDANNNQ